MTVFNFWFAFHTEISDSVRWLPLLKKLKSRGKSVFIIHIFDFFNQCPNSLLPNSEKAFNTETWDFIHCIGILGKKLTESGSSFDFPWSSNSVCSNYPKSFSSTISWIRKFLIAKKTTRFFSGFVQFIGIWPRTIKKFQKILKIEKTISFKNVSLIIFNVLPLSNCHLFPSNWVSKAVSFWKISTRTFVFTTFGADKSKTFHSTTKKCLCWYWISTFSGTSSLISFVEAAVDSFLLLRRYSALKGQILLTCWNHDKLKSPKIPVRFDLSFDADRPKLIAGFLQTRL